MMKRQLTNFSQRYGPWALIAGASEGLGAAFAKEIASRGISVILLARRAEKLAALAAQLAAQYQIEVQTIAIDLGDQQAIQDLTATLADLDVGLIVYNAAYAPVGNFVEREPADLMQVIDVNVRGPVLLLRAFAPHLVSRGRGGIVVMSSLAGLQGTPRLATYAASKAFGTILAESLWGELRADGVDIIASCAGAIRTPGYQSTESGSEAPGTMDAAIVATHTLNALGRGPRVVPGWLNKVAQLVVGRLLPRSLAVRMMKQNTETLT